MEKLTITGASGSNGLTIEILSNKEPRKISFVKEGRELAELLFENLPAVTLNVLKRRLINLSHSGELS